MSIKKIAEIVGVSYSTVSRVLRDPNHKCASEEIRKKIIETARQVGYVPNEAARNLKLGIAPEKKVYYIGIVVTRTETPEIDPFFNEITRIIEVEIHKSMCVIAKMWYKPEFSFEGNTTNQSHDKTALAMLEELDTPPDGIVIIGKCTPSAIRAIRKHFKSAVSINRNTTNYEIDEVTCDGKKIASIAVEYLVSLGHRKIGYVGDCHNESRYKGYRETLLKYDLDCDIDYSINIRQSEDQGYKVMEMLMQHRNPPTAIYCANDIIAVGMIRYMNKVRNHYYTPSIIASDDIEEAQFTNPMLTTVGLPKEEMARMAIYLLLDRINKGHRSVMRVEFEGSLIVRNSCSSVNNVMSCDYII